MLSVINMPSVDDEMHVYPVCGHDFKIIENDDGRHLND